MDTIILRAGTAVAVITPPLEAGLLTSSVEGRYAPFTAVRLPLKARVLALLSGDTTVVLVSLDLLGLSDTATRGWARFKQGLSDDIAPEHIIITCTHTHNAPESVALSPLYETEVFRQWLDMVQQQLRNAIRQAVATAQPCKTDISKSVLEGYSLQRRIPTQQGIAMSDSMQPISAALMQREPVDRRVHTIRFRDNAGHTIATIVHAVCHPVHEMCLPHISPDFPGELCGALETAGGNGMAMFLNGAAGDTNPPTVSEGAAAAKAHGQALAAAVQQVPEGVPLKGSSLAAAHEELAFQVRIPEIDNPGDALGRINIIALGNLALVFLPGEPFIITAMEMEKLSPFEHTIITAYAENTIGYIPTAAAFKEGGYEAGPGKWSFLEITAAARLQDVTLHLLQQLKKQNG